MAYSRPIATSADASWASAGGYVRPAGASSDASFAVTANYIESASSFGPIVSFGTPCSPYPQEGVASGFSISGFGRPVASVFMPPIIGRFVSGSSFLPVKFGLATAGAQVSTRASGQTSTTFGSPNSRRAQPAQSLAPTVTFGLPSASAGTRATGFQAPSFGTPTTRTTHRAASVYRATRWGLPTAERSNTYKVRGIDLRARFGQPAAHRLNAYRATAGAPTTQFGTPVATPRYRAFHLPPETRFGKPRLIRSPAC